MHLPTPHSDDDRQAEAAQDALRTGVALSASETVGRFGDANAEFLKGYRGIDHATSRKFAKSLAGIARHKIHPDHMQANILQQAGYSAEVAVTSRDNAEAIIARSRIRTVRSDDLPQYGKNHHIVDRVQVLDGRIIEGSQAQMKFVGTRDRLLKDIAREDGKFARYRGIRLELPSDHYEGAAQHCREQAGQLRFNAARAEANGHSEAAAALRREADNYDQLAGNVRDSGMTRKQAVFYREHPQIATALDMVRTSHRAGLEGAQYGAVIGGCVSLLQNVLALAQDAADPAAAAKGLAKDTAAAAALGYGTAFAGSLLKSGMQQSGRQSLRTLAGTSAPALAVNVCLSLGSSIKRYLQGEISEARLLAEVGEKGAGMLSGSMMAALGQLAVPVPFVGAALGGMIGCMLSSLFYQSALDAARGAELSRQQLARVRAIQKAARSRVAQHQAELDAFTRREIPQLRQETQQLFAVLDACDDGNIDALAAAVNRYAGLLGKELAFITQDEFDEFMDSDKPLAL